MPILVIGLLALLVFGLIGILLVFAMLVETRRKNELRHEKPAHTGKAA